MDLCAPDGIGKLEVLETMRAHLSRDFLALLPPEMFLYLLSFLSVEDLITCLQVSRGWRKRICDADPIWKSAPWKLGLDDFVVSSKLPKYGSMRSLVLAAWRHRRSVSSSVPFVVEQFPNVPEYRRSWCYAGNGIIYDERMTAIAQIGSPCTVSFVGDHSHISDVNSTRPLWAVADRHQRYLTWRGAEHSSWSRYRFGHDHAEHWQETQDLSLHVADVCDHCGLIASIRSEIAEGASIINMTIRKLLSEHRQPMKSYCLLGIPTCLVNHRTFVTDIEVFCQGWPGDSVGGDTHNILVRYECGSPGSGFTVIAEYSFPTAVHCPREAIRSMQTLQLQGGGDLSFFQLSSDGRLASVVDQSTRKHHVWKLGGSSEHFIVPAPQDTSCCLTLGHLYSILQCTGSVEVVVTYTGEVLLSCPFQPSLQQRFWDPLDHTWLNEFDFYQENQWHIVALYSTDSNLVRSIVGRRPY